MLNNEIAFIDLSKERNNLGSRIVKELNIEELPSQIINFSSGESMVSIKESVRGKNVFVLQTFSNDVNTEIMQLLICIDSLKRASAKEINIIIPMYPYARQDRKAKSREPISARLLADMIETAGAHRVITFDLHSSQVQGFFNIPIDNYFGLPELSNYLMRKHLKDGEDIVVVSPDHGGVNRARKLAQRLDSPIAIIDKRRPKPNVSEVTHIVGDVEGKTAIIIDDMIDTAGSLCNAAKFLKSKGATKVIAMATHPIFSGPALERIKESDLERVIVTDSISHDKDTLPDNINVLSINKLIAKAVEHTNNDISVTSLFKEGMNK